MARSHGVFVSGAPGGLLIAGDAVGARVLAQEAAPDAAALTTIVLTERNEHETNGDLGDPGPSAGDLRVWGPNPLFDAGNVEDTGATTQGSCVALNAANDCLAQDTVVFTGGSTLEMQVFNLARGTHQPARSPAAPARTWARRAPRPWRRPRTSPGGGRRSNFACGSRSGTGWR